MSRGSSTADNVVWHTTGIGRQAREASLGQRACLLWLTGLSGSGKSTIADALEMRLHSLGRVAYLLDGDNVRHGLCRDLGFSAPDRRENIRRVGEVGRLLVDAGLIAIASFISPYRADRLALRQRLDPGDFIEIHISTPLSVCEARDPKGLYAKARAGEIPSFTGITDPYEEPEAPELRIDAALVSVDDAVDRIISLIDSGSATS